MTGVRAVALVSCLAAAAGCGSSPCGADQIEIEDGTYVQPVATSETNTSTPFPETVSEGPPATLTVDGDEVVFEYVDPEGRTVRIRYVAAALGTEG